jgi:AraC-like DNA-binding protein
MVRGKWLKLLIAFLAAFQFIWLIFMIPYLIPSVNIALLNAVGWYPVFVPLVFLIYWMGIKGYLISKTESGIPNRAVKAVIDLAPERSASVLALLIKAMESDKLFLRQDLNISLLSTHTGINSKTISAVLNNCIHQNFSQWINNYRVSAFKEKIKAGESDHLTLAGIAAECGFSSQASFQRIFKQSTGVIPSNYRNTKEL